MKGAPVLTIGRLAAHVGVTVRAVRHYHQRGLLAEPERDRSGYRRYGAQAVVDLIRIKTLADAGVPLARIDELLAARPEEFARAVTEVEQDLSRRIRELTRRRRSIARLAAGDRLFLPSEVIGILDRQRAFGVSERMVRIERDSWIMLVALAPESVPEWVAAKEKALADPDFRRLYLTCDEAMDWEADDPRLPGLAAAMAAWKARQPPHELPGPGTLALMDANATAASPAWRRLEELLSRDRRV
ncbi:MerR family transcriptional regulator [Streptomyces rimosus subsp. rimosus]|nr:MerR family transcriptional regulator [Streptomyces sp. NRRL WC-3701]KOT31685.1 MerR family transcriptional regulator [Streptomyces rimosus subsp. rimosus]KOT50591.1 MerR family transcriptional regulator [Streptomyces rimosus subsp. rimosus]KOT65273.1 MerR family transcriptional regulator [Streptomyces rimosus subsp. rimosus]KOT71582.1 MerR family transcriptional regulator [Streptomyces rimosus subsp. rimosus]